MSWHCAQTYALTQEVLLQVTKLAGSSQAPSVAQQRALLCQQQVVCSQSVHFSGRSVHIAGRAQGRSYCELFAEWQVRACAGHKQGRQAQLVCHRSQVRADDIACRCMALR